MDYDHIEFASRSGLQETLEARPPAQLVGVGAQPLVTKYASRTPTAISAGVRKCALLSEQAVPVHLILSRHSDVGDCSLQDSSLALLLALL